MALPYSRTHQGYEIQFGTNHMGHALLTKLLLPALLRTAEESSSDVRIINLSSAGHRFAYLCRTSVIYDQSAAASYNTWIRYGSAKLANILHAKALAKRYPQITATSVHPGVIDTNLFDAFRGTLAWIPGLTWFVDRTVPLLMKDPATGALNQVWCAVGGKRDEVRRYGYFEPVGKGGGESWQAKREKTADELWDWTEGELQKHGF